MASASKAKLASADDESVATSSDETATDATGTAKGLGAARHIKAPPVFVGTASGTA